MTGLSFLTFTASLVLIYTTLGYYVLGQAAETCSTEEARRAAVDKALSSIECEHFNCGKS